MGKKRWTGADAPVAQSAPVEAVPQAAAETKSAVASYLGKSVAWDEGDTKYSGKVTNQKVILEVRLDDGSVIGVDASKVTTH